MTKPPLAPAEVPDTTLADEAGICAADAEQLVAQATVLRQSLQAAPDGDPLWRASILAQAAALEAVAGQALVAPHVLERGAGGEVALRENSDDPYPRREVCRATRQAPNMLDAEATIERLSLAREAGALTLAVDAAQASGATTPAELMLAHQMAAAHAMAMRLTARADTFLARRFIAYGPDHGAAEAEARREQVASIEAARLTGAAARMMEATARAAVALDRLKNGTRQTIIVQQTMVQEGGQAVVAGVMKPPRKGGKGKRRGGS